MLKTAEKIDNVCILVETDQPEFLNQKCCFILLKP